MVEFLKGVGTYEGCLVTVLLNLIVAEEYLETVVHVGETYVDRRRTKDLLRVSLVFTVRCEEDSRGYSFLNAPSHLLI